MKRNLLMIACNKKKLVLFLLLFVFSKGMMAGTITTTSAGGNWSLSSTWMGSGSPVTGDNVIIAPTATVYVDGSTALVYDITVKGILNIPNNNTSILNLEHDMYVDSFGTFICNDRHHIHEIGHDLFLNNAGTVSNTGYLFVHHNFTISSNGGYLLNSGTMCVQDSTINHGTFYGMGDFCDLTPPASKPYIDINTGTVDTNMTYCNSGGCSLISVREIKSSPHQIKLYPNPANDILTVKFSEMEKKEVSFRVFDAMGREFLVYSAIKNDEMEIHISGLAAGIYFLKIKEGKEQEAVRKFTVAR